MRKLILILLIASTASSLYGCKSGIKPSTSSNSTVNDEAIAKNETKEPEQAENSKDLEESKEHKTPEPTKQPETPNSSNSLKQELKQESEEEKQEKIEQPEQPKQQIQTEIKQEQKPEVSEPTETLPLEKENEAVLKEEKEEIEKVEEVEKVEEKEETEKIEEVKETKNELVDAMPKDVKDPYFDNYGSGKDAKGNLSNKKLSWYFNKNTNHQPPAAQKEFDIRQYDGYYLGDIENKIVYLTFDEGYENGNTEKILDVLKEKGVKATFFVTKSYIKANVELIKRMVEEEHIVGNHSVTHKSFPDLKDEEITSELEDTAEFFKETTGKEMPKVFRPPMGEYSARTLSLAKSLGYKTIFWSFAYKDWLVDEQPGKDVAYKTVMDNLHSGSIMLLHPVSTSNAEALPDIIDSIKKAGFKFGSLNDL